MPRKLAHVSARKVAANRQNALKSTGPKTPEGKAHSRTNALKYGLFAIDMPLCGVAKENSQEYTALLKSLRKDYEPVGIAEHLEVERIAACWWKLRRAWRYENSEILRGLIDVEKARLNLINPQQPVFDSPLSSEYETRDLLRKAEAEIVATGKISDELKAKMEAADERFQRIWPLVDEAERKLRQFAGDTLSEDELRVSDFRRDLLLRIIRSAIDVQHQELIKLVNCFMKGPFDLLAVPNEEALDRALRADAAAERNLGRAMDRLERLQRRRKGEAVPPPVSVRLSR